MKIEIKKTEKIIEYKNFYFADVYNILIDGKLIGNKMVDKGVKSWYAIFFDSKKENEIKLPDGCSFGENVIYAHSIEEVKAIFELIKDI